MEEGEMKSSPTGLKLLPELEMDILSRLPVKSLFRFRCVSKEWLRLLTVDTHFINNMHLLRSISAKSTNPNPNPNPSLISLQLYTIHTTEGCCYISDACDIKPTYFNFPENKKETIQYYDFDGICNGLVCLTQYTKKLAKSPSKLVVWNPLTTDHITISYFGPFPLAFRLSCIVFDFGFHQATNQYKLVKLLFSDEPEVSPHISLFTLGGTKTWRTLDIVFYHFGCRGFPITINGSPHWLIHKSGSKHYLIVAFDVEDEVFQEIPLPVQVENDRLCPKIKEFGGLLCVINTTLQKEIEIWVMKEHGVPSSWTKQFVIRETQIFKIDCWEPIGIASNGEVTFMRSRQYYERELLLYDPKTD